jgi:GT2 family glycosyltransferase
MTSPNPAALRASVVICAWTLDRFDQVLGAVASTVHQSPRPAQVLVVADHNAVLATRLRTALQDFGSTVTVLENAHAAGLSGARNTGAAAAVGDVVAFLDDDAVARPGWLAALLDAYAEGPDVLAVGGAARASWAHGRPTWFPEEFDWVVGCSYRGLPDVTAEVRNLIGANMSYRSHVFADVGPFREDLGRLGNRPVGCEETEFGIRLRRRVASARCLYLPHAQVEHHVPAQRTSLAYFIRRCYAEGLSKARMGGPRRGRDLDTERRYVRHVLPLALRENVRGARGPGGWRRGGALLLGLSATTAGYLAAGVSLRAPRAPALSWMHEQ